MTTLAIANTGTTISISASAPATYDAAGYAAVSYTAIAEVTDIGELGDVSALITHMPIGEGRTYKFKGIRDAGSLALKMAKAPSDAGQVLLTAAAAASGDYTFHIVTPDNRDYYFTGKVMNVKTTIGAGNQIVGTSAEVQISGAIVETA